MLGRLAISSLELTDYHYLPTEGWPGWVGLGGQLLFWYQPR